MLKKLLASVILASFLLTILFVPRVHAQEGAWYNQSFGEWFTKVDESPENEIFGERYTAAQVQWVVYGFFYFIINGMTNGNTGALTCVMTKTLDECADAINDLKDSLSTNNQSPAPWISVFTTRPVSSFAYFKDVGQRLKLIPEAKAQGFGFEAANPTLKLWKISRNATYAFLVLVVTVMAFMIMFRVKISPQTVISVQSALPKVILTLVLITFSYAIAGFLIDLMYVVIGLFSAFIVQNGISSFRWQEMFGALTTDRNVFMLLISYWFMFLLATFLNIFNAAFNLSFTFIPTILAFIFAIVSILLLLWYSIKIIILLLKTYIQILLLIIVAPFQILLGAIVPGTGFGSWLRSMAANLTVYPLVGILFILAFVFLRAGLPEGNLIDGIMPFDIEGGFLSGEPWDPPLTMGTGGAAPRFLWIIVSFGVIVLIPKVNDIIQSLIQGKPFPYGTAIGETFAPVGRYGPAAGIYTVSQLAQERYPFGFRGRTPEWLSKPAKDVRDALSGYFKLTKGQG